jgi:hypothetical protein
MSWRWNVRWVNDSDECPFYKLHQYGMFGSTDV